MNHPSPRSRPAAAPTQAQIDGLVASYQQGRMTDVVTQAEALLARHPQAAAAYQLLGAAHLSSGNPAAAEKALCLALAQGIRAAAICNNLAMAIAEQGRHEEAAAFYREAIALDPGHAIARNNLGNALKACGQLVEALRAYAEAIAIQPDYADAYLNMGLLLEALGRPEDAQGAFMQALALQPNHAAAWNNLGNVRTNLGDLAEAAQCYERALAIRPAYAEAWFNLGNVFQRQKRIEEALRAYEQARAARLDYADAWTEQGKTLALTVRYDEAVAAFDAALAAEPGHAEAQAHRLFCQAHMCEWSAFEAWQQLDEGAGTVSSPSAALTFEDDPARQLRRSRAWVQKACPQPATSHPPLPPTPAPTADGRIRIGYFSADLHDHATAYLIAGLLREHDRSRFAIHAFSYGPPYDDAMRRQLAATTEHFFDVHDLPDTALAELARRQQLDIAVDLKGWTQNTRLGPFARRLAPLQIGYLGYPGSSGADFIDYLVADPVVIPEAERARYSEQLILLPDSYQPNDDRRPIAETDGTRADWSLPETGFVFCCFNHTYKITQREFDIWMRLLGRVRDSVLWLLRSNAWAERNLRRAAEARGIAADRLVFADYAPHAEHLARLRHADLFIDTFNVNAHTTASDALWAGVPLVSLAGRQFAARVGASLLSAVGLPELIADSAQDYEALALDLATRPERLAQVRAALAANRLTQPLFDTARYARKLEAAYEAVHRRHVEGAPPTTVSIA